MLPERILIISGCRENKSTRLNFIVRGLSNVHEYSIISFGVERAARYCTYRHR